MGPFLEPAVTVGLVLLGLAILCAFVRLARGPSVADRIVALDAIAAILVSAALLHALSSGLAVFIDVALTIALVSFLGTVALARAMETGGVE